VVGNGTDIRVTLHDGTVLPATVLGTDEQTDIAVLRIDPPKPLMAVAFGDSDFVKVGDWVIAVGNPFGLGGTVTAGIVSARQRDIHTGPSDDFLQIDASINQGNSGGPTFDLGGQVIGINTAIFSPNGGSVGIGFAIPANVAKPVIAQLRSAGRVTRGWLGVQIQPLTRELADALGVAQARGALITEVTPKSPAAAVGLQAGDVIQGYLGKPVGELREVTTAVSRAPIGSAFPVQVVRDGKPIEVSITIAELKAAEPERQHAVARVTPPTPGATGLKLTALNASVRQRFGIPGQIQGVLVIGVAETSAAAELGLQPGDIIEQVNGRKVGNPKDVTAAITAAGKSGRKTVALLVNRQGQKEFVALPVAES
jgi:serine protease Do